MVSSAPKEMFKEGLFQASSRHHTHPPFLPKENKGPHMKIRPPAYGSRKEKKGPQHGEKGLHNVKENPHGKYFQKEANAYYCPPPLGAHVWH